MRSDPRNTTSTAITINVPKAGRPVIHVNCTPVDLDLAAHHARVIEEVRDGLFERRREFDDGDLELSLRNVLDTIDRAVGLMRPADEPPF